MKINGFWKHHERPQDLARIAGVDDVWKRWEGFWGEGFWGCVEFEQQTVNVMYCFDVLYHYKHLMVEVDHSAVHAKFHEDRVHVGNMNARYGGKQKTLCDMIVTGGCLGLGG